MRRLAFLFACLAFGPAQAETIHVDVVGAKVALEIPQGFCTLDRQQAVDNGILTNMERAVATTNRVLSAFAQCAQLDELRNGSRTVLDDFGSYMTPLRGNMLAMEPAEFARQLSQVFKSQGAQIMQGAENEIRRSITEMDIGVRVGEQRMIGVLRTDARATYLGVVQNIGLPGGRNKVQLALVVTGLLRQRIVSLNLYTPYGEGNAAAETTFRLLGMGAQTYETLAAANVK